MRISDWSSDVCSSDLAPKAEFGADGDDRLAPRGQGNGAPGPIPDLDQCRRKAKELLTGRSELGPRLVAGEDGTIELIFKHTNTGADSSLGEVEIGRCANEAASLDDFEKRPRNTNIHPAISRRSMYYNIHFLVAYYRVHALLTRKDRRGRASTDGTPRDWTDRDIKSLRPFRPDPSPDRKSKRLNSSHSCASRMPSSA